MNSIINWLNENNGALMVVITLVYVIATICISYFNKKSAEASRDQIEESQKQQKQNVGLQLYATRKEIIDKVSKKQYNEIFWDIPLLFNDELFSEFQKTALKSGKIEELHREIDLFEGSLGLLAGAKASEQVKQIRRWIPIKNDIDHLKESVVLALANTGSRTDYSKSVEEYIKNVAEEQELERQRAAETTLLLVKLREFVKESISEPQSDSAQNDA